MTAPIYVYTQAWDADTFVPYPDGPTIRHTGTLVSDQSTLNAVIAAAAASGVNLQFDSAGPVTAALVEPYPYVRYDRPQPALTPAQQAQARANLGVTGTGGGSTGGTGGGSMTVADRGTYFTLSSVAAAGTPGAVADRGSYFTVTI
jgi:hypothetical protein